MRTCQQAISLPPPVKPLPILPPLLLSISALFLQNLRHITEASLTRHLRTRTTIGKLSLTLFQVRVRDVSLSDCNGEPLLTAENLAVTGRKKEGINFAIAANGITLHADINPVDWDDSNWSTHLSRISRMGTGEVIKYPETRDSKDTIDMKVPKGRCAVSLTTQQTAIHIMKPSITLSLPPLVIPSTDLSSIASIHRLIDGLLGRAAREAGTRSFPRELRMGARRAAQGVAVRAVDRIFAEAGTKVGQWRRKVDEAQEYVKDIPDIKGARKAMKDVGGVLRSLENLLRRDEDEEMQSANDGQGEDVTEGFRELDEGDAVQ